MQNQTMNTHTISAGLPFSANIQYEFCNLTYSRLVSFKNVNKHTNLWKTRLIVLKL